MQPHRTTYLFFVLSLVTLALLQLLSVKLFLYWVYPALDIPMHVLGGVTVALGFLALAPRFARESLWRGLSATLLVVLVVGVGWEAYEYATGTIFDSHAPIADTILDVVMDLVGGALGFVVARATSST